MRLAGNIFTRSQNILAITSYVKDYTYTYSLNEIS